MEIISNPKSYRWFYTSSGNLVIGGKNAEQNDELLRKIKLSKKELFIMHTSEPGSPFSIILAEEGEVSKTDLEECAVFTGCFSRAWKALKSKTNIDIFLSTSLYKSKTMAVGTWGVKDKLSTETVELKLCLIEQDKTLRAVPPSSIGTKKALLCICPGSIDKREMVGKINESLKNKYSEEDILSALPSGGVKICKK